MNRIATILLSALLTAASFLPARAEYVPDTGAEYVPSEQVRESQREFAADRFGIFIHWGIYSMFGQGEWYLNYGPRADEYAKAARGFYPADFHQGIRRPLHLLHHTPSRRFLDVAYGPEQV